MLQTVFSVSSFSPSEEDIERKKEKIYPFALCLKSQIAGLDHTGVLALMQEAIAREDSHYPSSKGRVSVIFPNRCE